MTQQFNVTHGHPDGDLLTSILAYEWFLENKRHYNHKCTDWETAWTQDWKVCSKVGLMHHVLVAIHESVIPGCRNRVGKTWGGKMPPIAHCIR